MNQQLVVHESEHGYTVIELIGRLVPGQEPEIADLIKETAQNLCEQGKTKLLFDLRNVDYMASNAIGALMTVYNTVMIHSGKLVLWRPKTYLHDSLKLVKIDKLLNITNSFEEAMKWLGIQLPEDN